MLNNPAKISQIGHESIAEITFALIIDRKDRATDQTAALDLVHTQKDQPNVTNICLYPENGTPRLGYCSDVWNATCSLFRAPAKLRGSLR